MRNHLVMLTMVMVSALTLAGCGRSDGVGNDPAAAFPGRAVAVAAAWQAAAAQSAAWKTQLVALQSLTVVPSGKLPDDAQFRAALTLPRDTPSPAKIALPDGGSVTASLVSASAAFGELGRARGGIPCDPGAGSGAGVPAPTSTDPGTAVGGPAVHTCTP
uniref:hypothetical protein n=1 Tax=Allorhizocola rhizosphaerae TaxID=1872709 RepID=UPI001B8B12B3